MGAAPGEAWHLEHDCSTGQATWRAATVAEAAEIQARQAEHIDRAESAAALRAADLATVAERAAEDPAFAALARLAGIQLPAPDAPGGAQ